MKLVNIKVKPAPVSHLLGRLQPLTCFKPNYCYKISIICLYTSLGLRGWLKFLSNFKAAVMINQVTNILKLYLLLHCIKEFRISH